VLATNRYYDPTEGRWLTRDPIGYAGGLNLYAYCGGNPVNLADPLGLCGGEQGGSDYYSFRGYLRDVGQVFAGYGDAIGGTVKGTLQLGAAGIKAQLGDPSDLIGIVKGIPDGFVQMAQGTFQLSNPRQFGQCFGGALITTGSIAAPGAKGVLKPPPGGGAKGMGLKPVVPKEPLPPGYNSNWSKMWGTREGATKPHWFDPQGGEWRWHAPDDWHGTGHWDYNPWTQWNSPWQNVYPK
jgi:hypothetical protein